MGEDRQQIVIVGAGHAAGQCVASLRQGGVTAKITLIGDERHLPYQRPPLSKAYLSGDLTEERLFLRPLAFYQDQAVDLVPGRRVTDIDRERHVVQVSDGAEFSWDKLILATGAPPRQLVCPGGDLGNIFNLRTIEDVERIKPHFVPGKKLAVVGAGYIGLEVAAVARKFDIDVTVIEMADRVLSRVTGPEISSFYQQVHAEAGVKLMLNAGVHGFTGEDTVAGVSLADGRQVPCDFALVGIGSVPASEVAQEAGLAVDNGIIVDELCRTSDPNIYAIGDCTNHPNAIFAQRLRLESVHNALEQAKAAAAHIAGRDVPYRQVPWFWSDQYDLKLQTVGLWSLANQRVVRGDPATRSFSVFYLCDDRLVCVDAVNDPASFALSKRAIMNGHQPDLTSLGDPSTDIKSVLS